MIHQEHGSGRGGRAAGGADRFRADLAGEGLQVDLGAGAAGDLGWGCASLLTACETHATGN
jgi:hypothetical protein